MKLEYPFDEAIIHITGNAGKRFFGVTAYDASNSPDLLVNTTDVYDGVRILGKGISQDPPVQLEVKAQGAWTADILPLSAARHLAVPGKITGEGDDVIVLDGPASIAKIKGNQAERFFGIVGYGGILSDLLVNSTDAYEGTTKVSSGTNVLVIQAVGQWEVELE